MLKENKDILKKAYPHLWNRLKLLEDTRQNFSIHVEETKQGNKTLWTEKNGKKVYFHSKYNPIREAQAIVEEYDDIEPNSTVVFYGTGLGYHIDLFLKKHPHVKYYIYEPIPELLYTYLLYNSLSKVPSLNLKDIILGEDEETIRSFFSNLVDKSGGTFIQISLNSHKNIYAKEYNKFVELFKQTLKDKKFSIGTTLAFQERWIINCMKNFKEVLNTPNILLEKKGAFKGKPAILVAAGPSLNEEIENIRYIKENKLAYIFSVGSAINTLIYHDIYPDAACTYDPTINNQKVFAKVKEKNIKDIPMIFGSSVGYETLIGYPGHKYHMITSQDTVSNYYLKNEDGSPISIVQDAPSIAVVTLQLLYEMGFSPIILVGQNLAYRGKERHSEGVYYSSEVTEEEMKKGIWVNDVYGNEVLTNEGFNSMRQQMEYYINNFPGINVINTTKGGAHIEGTSFMEFQTVIDEYLKERVVEDNWLEGNKTKYDKEFLKNQSEKMDRAYKRALRLMDEYYELLSTIEKLINNRNFKQAENMYTKLDKAFRKIERNEFFKVFILPMNRVQYKILADSIDSLNEEKNPVEKGKRIVNDFRKFMDLCRSSIEKFEPVYLEFRNTFLDSKCAQIEYDSYGYNIPTIKPINFDNILLDPNLFTFYDVRSLLAKQYKNNRIFNRMDIIVRYLAIENYYGKNDYGYKLYEKMQKARGQKVHNLDRFKALIESIEKNGFDDKSSILVDSNLQLVDGSHRLACALYFNVDKIPIKIQQQVTDIRYSIDWFENVGFSKDELEIIESKQKEIIVEKGIYFVAILWPPIQDYFDEITKELNREYKLLSIKDYTFDNDNEFIATIKELYAVDDIEDWKIDKKLTYMRNYNKKIRIITFDIGDPKFRAKARNGKPISVKVEEIKKKYREKYSQKIDNYFYDIIMHIGDNYEHSTHMIQIMEKYNHTIVEIPSRSNVDEWMSRYLDEINEMVRNNNLRKSDFCIVGSSILEISNIRKSNDVDIVVLYSKRRVLTNETSAYKISDNIEIVGEGWAKCLGIEDEELITNSNYHFKIDGIKFVKLELLFLKKICMNREKDILDVDLINKQIANGLKWDTSLVEKILNNSKNHQNSIDNVELNGIYFSPKNDISTFVINEINMAKKTLDIAMFGFDYKPIADAIIKAKRRGVLVRVQLDKKSHKKMIDELGNECSFTVVEYLQKNNINCRVYENYEFYILMHHKLILIDEDKLLFGSANFLCKDLYSNFEHFIMISNRSMKKLFDDEFNRVWNLENNVSYYEELLNIKESMNKNLIISTGNKLDCINVKIKDILFSTINRNLTDVIVYQINNAKKTIYVIQSIFSSVPIANALINAQKRGVDVKVLTNDYNSFRRFYTYLASNNINLKLYRLTNDLSGIIHHKFTLIDDSTILLGSVNYYEDSLRLHIENLMLIESRELFKILKDNFIQIWNNENTISYKGDI